MASKSFYGPDRGVIFKSHTSVAPSSVVFKVKVKDTLDGDSVAALMAVGSRYARSENPNLGNPAKVGFWASGSSGRISAYGDKA